MLLHRRQPEPDSLARNSAATSRQHGCPVYRRRCVRGGPAIADLTGRGSDVTDVRVLWCVAGLVGALTIPAHAQTSQPDAQVPQDVTAQVTTPTPDPAPPPQQPATADEPKPTRNFFSALVHNLGNDVRHMPRRNNVYWLAGGAGAALAVHPADESINEWFINDTPGGMWKPGHIIGSTPVLLGSAAATYLVGRFTDNTKVEHLGMDGIEAALLAEGFTQAIKVIARRDRPEQVDGNQSTTFSFPSGHATITFAAATVLQQHPGYKAGIPTYALATYVAMSRLHDTPALVCEPLGSIGTDVFAARTR